MPNFRALRGDVCAVLFRRSLGEKTDMAILAAASLRGATVRISGLADRKSEQSSSDPGLVAQGSSEKHSAHIAPSKREKFGMP